MKQPDPNMTPEEREKYWDDYIARVDRQSAIGIVVVLALVVSILALVWT